MKIAVTSQNRKNVTEHAGRCRKFWIFETDNNAIIDKQLLELPKEQAFHDASPHDPHPLDDMDVLIAGGMGQGLVARLGKKGIKGLVTSETDPETAVSLYLDGTLSSEPPCSHSHGKDQE
jgi:predicted Fe-Mo cluster-binding NifX family protein